jgi:hypothetical protein
MCKKNFSKTSLVLYSKKYKPINMDRKQYEKLVERLISFSTDEIKVILADIKSLQKESLQSVGKKRRLTD